MKKTTVLILLYSIYVNAFSQFLIKYNVKTGSVKTIANISDPNQMNWIFSSSDSYPSWQKENQDWGMGKYTISGHEYNWTTPTQINIQGANSTLLYQSDKVKVVIARNLTGIFFTETYSFTNLSDSTIYLSNPGIYTPFNDNYPDAATCATNRCNAHVWPGMNSSYVNATRMNGKGPHLGLVLTKGSMQSYSIENRDKDGGHGYSLSNVRGTILLNMAGFKLGAGETYKIQWKLFWNNGWDDFFSVAKTLGFVRAEANKYVINLNDTLSVKLDAKKNVKLKKSKLTVIGKSLGEHSLRINYDSDKYTILNYNVISSPETLIRKRIHFIVKNQQMNNISDERYGAYMVYDNEAKQILTDTRGMVSPVDKDEGAERLGMGVLIAKWLQSHKDSTVFKSLERYVTFVRYKLQTKDYQVYSNASRTSRNRGYNYPWVADLYLQMFHLTGKKAYLKDFYNTLIAYYKLFGYQFYAIGVPVKDGINSLRSAGLSQECDSLLNHFVLVGNNYLANGLVFPKMEVNYEQSIVAPSVNFLCELYLVTQNEKYLKGAKDQISSLESFEGKQPDVHLNEIAIRHWDGYWFGKREFWGDVMPHYWSTLSAVAYNNFYQCTGNKNYKQKALRILQNNLLNFKEDGAASCAYIYPSTVNGKPAKFYDPYANDQDWALVFYLTIAK